MPNRIIKESICTSEKLNQLSDFNFRIWVCLLTYVDDYGRGKAHPAIVRGSCLPLRERVTNKDVEQGLHALADIGCIRLYTIDGESYLCFPGWDKHQTIRNKKSKFPAPPDSDSEPQKIESNCNQLKSNACNCSRNPIQSNTSIEEDEEEEDQQRARAIADAWERETGKRAAPALAKRLANTERLCAFEPGVLEAAIRLAGVKSQNPAAYVFTVCDDWLKEKIHTVTQAEEYMALRDQAGGRMPGITGEEAQRNMQDFRRRQRTAPKPEPEEPREMSMERRFDSFVAAYPNKAGRAKAYVEFVNLAPDMPLLEKMILAIQDQKRAGITLPAPGAWLKRRGWETAPEVE